MAEPSHNLAIETSSRRGAIALGRGDGLLETMDLPAKRRHNLDLVPTIDALLSKHGLAARDLVGEASAPPLEAAEAWVHEPNDDNRDAAQYAAQDAEIDDDTPLCALAALYADGTMGTGVLAEHPAPVGAVAHLVAGMNLLALDAMADDAPDHGTVLVDRALDIARGGNGRLDKE